MLLSIYAQIGFVVLAGTFAFALWKGDLAERVGGTLNSAAGVFALAVHPLLDTELQPIALLVVDAGLALGFLFLAIRFASLWLGGAMLLQAVQFGLHAYYMVMELPHDLNYARINNIDTTGIAVFIIVGTVTSWRRRSAAAKKAQAAAAAAATPPAA